MMNTYCLNLNTSKNLAELTIENLSLCNKKWFGKMAELIFHKAKKMATNPFGSELVLTKQQLQRLFIFITKIQHHALYELRVDNDLADLKHDNGEMQQLQFLLSFIRMNPIHLSHSQLQNYFFEEFTTFDAEQLNHCLNCLEKYHLIQSIWVNDDTRFYDKNPSPHDHMYFLNEDCLVDCNKECFHMLSLKMNQLDHFSAIKMIPAKK